MNDERSQIVLERLARTMNLTGGVLSGVVPLGEVNMFNAGGEPVNPGGA